MVGRFRKPQTTPFHQKASLDKRKEEATRIQAKYPDRIPVIVQRSDDVTSASLPLIAKEKYLVPNNLTVGQFVYLVRKGLKLAPEHALILYAGLGRSMELPAKNELVSAVYKRAKDEDGFLYMIYAAESTFG